MVEYLGDDLDEDGREFVPTAELTDPLNVEPTTFARQMAGLGCKPIRNRVPTDDGDIRRIRVTSQQTFEQQSRTPNTGITAGLPTSAPGKREPTPIRRPRRTDESDEDAELLAWAHSIASARPCPHPKSSNGSPRSYHHPLVDRRS